MSTSKYIIIVWGGATINSSKRIYTFATHVRIQHRAVHSRHCRGVYSRPSSRIVPAIRTCTVAQAQIPNLSLSASCWRCHKFRIRHRVVLVAANSTTTNFKFQSFIVFAEPPPSCSLSSLRSSHSHLIPHPRPKRNQQTFRDPPLFRIRHRESTPFFFCHQDDGFVPLPPFLFSHHGFRHVLSSAGSKWLIVMVGILPLAQRGRERQAPKP